MNWWRRRKGPPKWRVVVCTSLNDEFFGPTRDTYAAAVSDASTLAYLWRREDLVVEVQPDTFVRRDLITDIFVESV